MASSLGLSYLDTGAMYRALTWWLMSVGVDTADEPLVAVRAAEAAIEVGTDPDDPWTRVNGNDVSREIRSEAVSAQAAIHEIRVVSQVRHPGGQLATVEDRLGEPRGDAPHQAGRAEGLRDAGRQVGQQVDARAAHIAAR